VEKYSEGKIHKSKPGPWNINSISNHLHRVCLQLTSIQLQMFDYNIIRDSPINFDNVKILKAKNLKATVLQCINKWLFVQGTSSLACITLFVDEKC